MRDPVPLNPLAALFHHMCDAVGGRMANLQNSMLPPRTQPCSSKHHEPLSTTRAPGAAQPGQENKANENALYPSLRYAGAGAGVCYPLPGTRRVGWKAAPWVGFELAACYFWHSSRQLLNEMRKLLVKVLKVRQIPSCLINFSQILCCFSFILPAPNSSPCSLLS